MSQGVLFEDTFEVSTVDKDGKKFDRVSRLEARSESYNTHMTLDVNTQIYRIQTKERLALMLASTLHPDEMEDEAEMGRVWNPRLLEHSRADDYEYVMHGKVYKANEEGDRLYPSSLFFLASPTPSRV